MLIRVLAPDVVDKIAAGEVLDRPANLVKELVENSLDADCGEIEIEFARGGRDVMVRDNGIGMDKTSLTLALTRHATSKITNSEDLFSLHTFGFRGEALASIAAVSRLALSSRERGKEQAYRLEAEFGAIGSTDDVLAVAAPAGTEVRVQDLFANVPARQSFLKSESAEHGQIKTTIKALAMANEKIGFRVRQKGELIFSWAKDSSFPQRVREVLGVQGLYEGEYKSTDGVCAQVLVSSPQETAQVNRNLWFFVQGRWVQDRSLAAAVMEAYRNLLMHGEYPTAVVRLTLAPEDVDVNVHPTKAQVKFRDSRSVFRAVHKAVRDVLERAPWLKPLTAAGGEGGWTPCSSERAAPEPKTGQLPVRVHAERAAGATSLKFNAPEFERTQYSTKAFPLAAVREAVNSYQPTSPGVASSISAAAPASAVGAETEFLWAGLQVVGQLNQTYIVAQSRDSFYLVDQHAAHERVMFERLMASFRLGRMDVQNLLLPLVVDVSAEEAEVLEGHRDEIERMGLQVESMGPESVAVQAIPSLLSESSVAQGLKKMAFELLQNAGSLALEKAVGDIFATMACHSVIRAGQSLSGEQMHNLLAQMDEFPLSSFCPHGRPVFLRRKFCEIEREFGRIP